jgi:AcrR family transcriptional regulator
VPRRSPAPPISRKQPRQERAASTVDAIVTAVERVLDAHGVAGLTTNRVAEVAGVSVGTLYQYYSNKQALVGALQERVLRTLADTIDRALTAAQDVPFADLSARIGDALVAVYRSQRPIHRWLIELRTEAAYQERFRRTVDEIVERVAAFLAARADFTHPEPRAAAFTIVAAVEGIANAVAARPGELDLARITAEAVRMIGLYLRA